MNDQQIKKLEDLVEFFQFLPEGQLPDIDHLKNQYDRVLILRLGFQALLVDPTTRDIPQYFDGNNIRTTDDTRLQVLTQVETPDPAADALITIAASSKRKVVGILAEMKCDGNAANRVFQVRITDVNQVVTLNHALTTGITLTLGQEGSILMATGHEHFTNDNGTIAIVNDENPLPMIVNAGGTIEAISSNKQVADQIALTVHMVEVI